MKGLNNPQTVAILVALIGSFTALSTTLITTHCSQQTQENREGSTATSLTNSNKNQHLSLLGEGNNKSISTQRREKIKRLPSGLRLNKSKKECPSLVGQAEPLPKGGKNLQNARPLPLGKLFKTTRFLKNEVYEYFRFSAKKGQKIKISFRTADKSKTLGKLISNGASILNPEGSNIISKKTFDKRNKVKNLEHEFSQEGEHFITIGSAYGNTIGAVYRFCLD